MEQISVENNHHWFKTTRLFYKEGTDVHHSWNINGRQLDIKNGEFNLEDVHLAVKFAGTHKGKTILDTMKIPPEVVFCARRECEKLELQKYDHEKHHNLMGYHHHEDVCCITFENYGELFSFIFVDGEHPDSVMFYINKVAENKYSIYYDR